LSTQPALVESPADSLLDDLRETPVADLGAAAQRAGHFTQQDDENHKRGVKGKNREALAKIKRCFMWFLFVIGCVASAVLVFGFILLVFIYLRHIISGSVVADPSALGQIIGGILWTALVAMATLWSEEVLKGEDR
jgi:hypothetical protein